MSGLRRSEVRLNSVVASVVERLERDVVRLLIKLLLLLQEHVNLITNVPFPTLNLLQASRHGVCVCVDRKT